MERTLQLEERELHSLSGELSGEEYSELLSLYLVENDLVNAKAVWSRTPVNIKSSSVEIKAIWEIAKAILTSDYAGLSTGFIFNEPKLCLYIVFANIVNL